MSHTVRTCYSSPSNAPGFLLTTALTSQTTITRLEEKKLINTYYLIKEVPVNNPPELEQCHIVLQKSNQIE